MPGLVGSHTHQSTHGVDFADQVAFAKPPIAGLQDITPMLSRLW
jgi:predicted amidohydrolase YtcJ